MLDLQILQDSKPFTNKDTLKDPVNVLPSLYLLTKISTGVKEKLLTYCGTTCARSGVN
jgi:hypothetical protein